MGLLWDNRGGVSRDSRPGVRLNRTRLVSAIITLTPPQGWRCNPAFGFPSPSRPMRRCTAMTVHQQRTGIVSAGARFGASLLAMTLHRKRSANAAQARPERRRPVVPPSVLERPPEAPWASPEQATAAIPQKVPPADRTTMRELIPFVLLIAVLVLLVVARVPFVSTPLGYVVVAGIATVATVVWTFRIARLPH
jgi:hypothetical protein